jgi:diaminohydroxyphosphoribosylaminopyrimidine deaminase/5-amino-6-(5-phosphoribosylamino)uracil reductase
VSSASDSPLWIVTTTEAEGAEALEARGVRILAAPAREGRVDLEWGLTALRAEGVWSLLVGGGSELLGALLAARLFDLVALFRAPLLLGGRQSRPAFGGPDPSRLSDAVRLTTRSPILSARGARGAAGSPAAPEGGAYEVWYPAGVRYGRAR